jgi:hypothetical protein
MIEVGGEKVVQEGYAVKYVDGYISWSPKDVFEAAYQPITAMSFGHAIEALKAGYKVCRAGWNGKGMWLDLQVPDEHSKMSLPYIYMFTADKHQVPWLASQTDVLANDWMIVGAPVEES